MERDLPSAHSLPQCLQQAELEQARARSQALQLVCLMGGQDPAFPVITTAPHSVHWQGVGLEVELLANQAFQ